MAAIGLLKDDVAVIIGAMVIAPLLGPNVALALATTLGDVKLAWNALKTNASGRSAGPSVTGPCATVFRGPGGPAPPAVDRG